MLEGDDMVDLERDIIQRLGHPAILASIAGSFPDECLKFAVHSIIAFS
jgi:hypothetical protein